MRTGYLLLIGAGVVALGLGGVQAVGADEGHGWRGEGHHGYHHRGDERWGHHRFGRDDDGDRRGRGRAGRASSHFALFFDLLDTDGDNRVSRAEALRPAAQRFARLDADKDGFATADEIDAAAKAEPGRFDPRQVMRLDADDDGKVSKSEYEVDARARFARGDADDDGMVTYQEFSGAMRGFHRRADMAAPAPAEADEAGGAAEEPGTSE